MAYQPIQMTARPPMFDAMEQLSQTLGQVAEGRYRAKRDSETKKRQDGQDYQSALTKAQALYQTGDYEGAAAMLAPYKGRVIQDHQIALTGTEPKEPISPQGLPPGTPPGAGKIPPAPQMGAPQGGSPMPDGAEFDMDHGQTPGQLGQEPIDQQFADSLPMPGMPGPQAPPPQPENPLFAAQAATKAKDQQKARTLLAFTPPGGQEQTIDPMAGMDRMRERRLAQLDQAFNGSQDPIVQKYFPQIRAAAAGSDEEIKPMDALRYMHFMAATEQTGVNAGSRIDASNANQEKNRGERERGFEVSMRNADVAAAARKASSYSFNNNPLKVDTGIRGDNNSLERAVKDMYAMADGKTLVKSDRTLHAAISNAAGKGPDAVMAHKDAFMQMERYFRGAVPTEAEQILLLKNMGGIPGAIDQFLEDKKTGDFSDVTLRNITYASKLALEEQEKNVGNFFSALKDRLGPGSEFELMGSNVNKQVKAQGRLYGYDLPDLYPRSTDGAGQAKLGAGAKARQPTAPKKGAPQSTADYLKEWDKP